MAYGFKNEKDISFLGGIYMRKVYCLHCQRVTLSSSEKQLFIPNDYICGYCNSNWKDVSDCSLRNGLFKQAYPLLKYKDIVVNKSYPLYP